MSTGTSQIAQSEIPSVFKLLTMVRPWVKCAIDGFPGSGKSRTAFEIAIGIYQKWKHDGPVFIFDNEKSAKFLVPGFKKQGIVTEVVESDQLDVFKMAVAEVERRGGLLLVDGATKIHSRTVKDYLNGLATPRKHIEMQDRPILSDVWREHFEDVLINAECHIVFTGRATNDWDGGVEFDADTKKNKRTFWKKGVKMMGDKDTLYAPDYAIYMERIEEFVPATPKKKASKTVWREATVLKDRSDKCDGLTFKDPSYKNFAPMFEFLLATPSGEPNVIEGNPKTIFGEGGDGGLFFRERAILSEEIQGEFQRAYPGQTAVEKRCRAELMQRFFGTRSWTKISEATPLQLLKTGLEGLRFFVEQELTEKEEAKQRTGFAESLEALNNGKAAPGELEVALVV